MKEEFNTLQIILGVLIKTKSQFSEIYKSIAIENKPPSQRMFFFGGVFVVFF